MLEHYFKSITDDRTIKFIGTARSMGINVDVLSEEFRILRFSYKGSTKLMLNEKLNLNKRPGTQFTKNKEITKIILKDRGIKVPTGIFAHTYEEAIEKMKKINMPFPVVVKPIDAAKGLGVTVGITSYEEINNAVSRIKKTLNCAEMECCGAFMIEKMKPGRDFRVLVLENKVIGCVERIPAYVSGDGASTIQELIERFNAKRPKTFLLNIDDDVIRALSESKFTLKSVLKKDERIQLRKNANISSGGRAVDFTDKISERFKNISAICAQALELTYTGIDILTDDITSDNPGQPYFVIEANGAPDYDIHEKPVVSGKGVDVTSLLVRAFMK